MMIPVPPLSVRCGGRPLTWPVTPAVAVAVACGVVTAPTPTNGGGGGRGGVRDDKWATAATTVPFPFMAITTHPIYTLFPTTPLLISSTSPHPIDVITMIGGASLISDAARALLLMMTTMLSHTFSDGGRGLPSGGPLGARHTLVHSLPPPAVGVDRAA